MTAGEFKTEATRLFLEGFEAEERGDLEEAVLIYARSARLGSSSAMINLGNLYDDVLNPRDPERAVEYYKAAVSRGNPAGASCLAAHYRNVGNQELSQYWADRAADMGDDEVYTS